MRFGAAHRKLWGSVSCLAVLLGLLVAGCGGGSSSPPGGVTVAINPSIVRVVVTGTQQFAANVTGTASAATIAASNGAVRASNIVTITTTSPHGFTQGQTVVISGVTDTSFNGTFIIASVPSTTTFTYSQIGSDATSGNGSVFNINVKWFVNDVEGGNATFGTITTGGLYTAPAALPPAATATIAANGAVRASNTVTITTTAAHSFVVGQTVVISGVTDASFNGTFSIATVPSTTTFTYSQTGANATSGGGTVSSFAVKVKAVSIADNTKSATAVVSIDSGIQISVKPTSATVGTSENLQFIATITGSSNTAVKWFVNEIEGGNATLGTISTNGLYTAPATPPNVTPATIAAAPTGAVRSSNTVTITTTAAHSFVIGQSVAIAGVTDTSFNGTFTIATVPSTTTFTYAQTGPNATSGGGTATPASATITIKATSTVDASRSASVSTNIVTAADPTLTSINPSAAAQGSLFQDVYLAGTNFISTTKVFFNGALVDTSRIAAVSGSLLRVRLPDSVLATATPPAGVPITVQSQRGTPANPTPQPFRILAVRPALVGASPDSGTQGGAVVNFNVNGGFYGAPGPPQLPAVTAEFDGSLHAATINSARQLSVVIGGSSGSSDLTSPGLISFAVRNAAAAQQVAVANLAVQPSPANIPSAPITTLSAGTQPGAVAINTATGIAVVANRGSNDITLIALTSPAPAICSPPPATFPGVCVASIPVGTSPTGVAVDNVRNLAVVANNGSNSVSIIDLRTGTNVPGSPILGNINAKPFSVGVNPQTGLALVTYQPVAPAQGTNVASIIDLTSSPPAVVGAVTVGDGTTPQVAVEPRLNWALVSPGGRVGSLSIVSLGGRRSLAIAAAPTGAVRAGNVATITTTAPHGLITGQTVLITGVADNSFNGAFTVASVPNSTTFTFAQTAANATSGGGSALDPGLQNSSGITANGALRTANVVTVTTTAPHGLLTDEAVLITGVADNSFNGYFTVSSVPSATTFAYAQTAANATSGGGAALYSNPLATVVVGNATGIAINPETEKAMLADPTTNTLTFFSVLDQTVTSFVVPDSCASTLTCAFAAAVNPLTDTGVSVNPTTNKASIVNPRATNSASLVIATVDVGTGPKAVAIDPGSNLAVVANEGSNNVSILSLGAVSGATAIRPLHITQLALPKDRQFNPSNPTATLVSTADLTLTIIGKGFVSGSRLRLDETQLPAPTNVTDRQMTVTVSGATFLTSARRYAVDVLNPGGTRSNVTDLTVIQPVDVTSTGCTAPAPRAVAIDAERNLALVTNTGCKTVSLIDLTSGAVTASSPVAVGSNPQGVAVISRLGKAVVTNRGDNTASVIDLTKSPPAVSSPVTLGTEPIGVAINQDTAQAAVANSGSNTVSLFSTDTGTTTPAVTTVSVDQRPVAVAIDSIRNLALVASSSGSLNQIDLSQGAPAVGQRYFCQQNPTGVVFDAASNLFVAACALGNSLTLVDPVAQQSASLRVGINPTSIANNFHSSTLVTVNTASNTMTVVDFLDRRVRAILGMTGSQQFSIDIHPRSNLAVIADENNNRVLLVPLPR